MLNAVTVNFTTDSIERKIVVSDAESSGIVVTFSTNELFQQAVERCMLYDRRNGSAFRLYSQLLDYAL